ncbi:unnamed protein product [Lasius platythorax]|uniref:Uncharacterized protein n=1 Tax=Lasius platythorax TaxID=488582 RepID=A0AAV2MYA7_9HYME
MNKNERFVGRTGQSRPRSSTAISRSFFSISTTPFVVSILLSVAAVTFNVPLDTENEEAFRFLREYGFLDNIEGLLSTDNATVLSRALFQEYYKLSGNGVLTSNTLRLMRKARCGVRDIPNQAISGRKWPRTHLTWNFQLANKHLLQMAETVFAL